MANVKVTFNVKASAKTLYLVGSTKNLGEWNPKNAVKLEKNGDVFTTSKLFENLSTIEFKFIRGKSYEYVEKGEWGEEIQNHSVVAVKGLVVDLTVNNFNK
jgi:hypothetical protein